MCDYTDKYLEKIRKSKIELEKITDIETEVKRLLDLRQQQKEVEKRIEGLGYDIASNKPHEMYYHARSAIFKELGSTFGLKLMTSEIRFFDHTDRPMSPFPFEEWLIPISNELDDLWSEVEDWRSPDLEEDDDNT
jgi:hypothetical protein